MFKKGLVKHNMITRKEKGFSCKDCGFVCCKGCPALTKNGCKLWGTTALVPCGCADFPITPLHLDRMGVTDCCKYYWDDKDVRLWW